MTIVHETDGNIKLYCEEGVGILFRAIKAGKIHCPICGAVCGYHGVHARGIPKVYLVRHTELQDIKATFYHPHGAQPGFFPPDPEHPEEPVRRVEIPIFQVYCKECKIYPQVKPDFLPYYKNFPMAELQLVLEQDPTSPRGTATKDDISASKETMRRWSACFKDKVSDVKDNVFRIGKLYDVDIPIRLFPGGTHFNSLKELMSLTISYVESRISSDEKKLADNLIAENVIVDVESKLDVLRHIISMYKQNWNIIAHANHWLWLDRKKMIFT
jgi:hypothetical protein